MTTPAVEIVNMPYGISVGSTGTSRTAVYVEGDRKNIQGNDQVNLPAGPCRIAFSWNGPEEVQLVVLGVGSIGRAVPVSGGVAASTAVWGAKSGERVILQNVKQENLKSGGRGTIEVYPLLAV